MMMMITMTMIDDVGQASMMIVNEDDYELR